MARPREDLRRTGAHAHVSLIREEVVTSDEHATGVMGQVASEIHRVCMASSHSWREWQQCREVFLTVGSLSAWEVLRNMDTPQPGVVELRVCTPGNTVVAL